MSPTAEKVVSESDENKMFWLPNHSGSCQKAFCKHFKELTSFYSSDKHQKETNSIISSWVELLFKFLFCPQQQFDSKTSARAFDRNSHSEKKSSTEGYEAAKSPGKVLKTHWSKGVRKKSSLNVTLFCLLHCLVLTASSKRVGTKWIWGSIYWFPYTFFSLHFQSALTLIRKKDQGGITHKQRFT